MISEKEMTIIRTHHTSKKIERLDFSVREHEREVKA